MGFDSLSKMINCFRKSHGRPSNTCSKSSLSSNEIVNRFCPVIKISNFFLVFQILRNCAIKLSGLYVFFVQTEHISIEFVMELLKSFSLLARLIFLQEDPVRSYHLSIRSHRLSSSRPQYSLFLRKT